MKRLVFWSSFCLAVLCTVQASAQCDTKQSMLDGIYLDPTLHEVVAPRHAPMMVGGFPRLNIDSTLDVLTYELWMDWVDVLVTPRAARGPRKAAARLRATVRMSSQASTPVSTISFDAIGLIVDSVRIDGAPALFAVTERTVDITLPAPRRAFDTLDVDIYYAISSDNRGLSAYAAADCDSAGLLEPIAFTFSQPEDARRFFPCNDKPYDKAVFTTHTRVPDGFTVVTNGVRIDSVPDGTGASWQSWFEATPKPTYLLAISASRYHRYDQVARLRDGREIPIANYHWLADHDGPTYNAIKALQNIPAMFEPFEDVFGPYPLETYGHMTVAPIRFGGMEHQTMSTINRRWLVGDVESGYAHELAHQWVGDYVTCATWADIWLNEGGASWGEALWFQKRYGPNGYQALLASRRNRYLRRGLDEPPVYGIPLAILFNEATTYSKSAWIYHMMQQHVGAEVFHPALQRYLQDYAFGAAQTADLLNVLTREISTPPVPWDTFFEQWLYKAGHPIFATVVRVSDPVAGQYPCRVTVRQVQSATNVPEAFVVPLTIRLSRETTTFDTTVMVSSRVSTFDLVAPFLPDSVTVDPNSDLLCERTSAVVTSVDEDAVQAPMTIASAVPLVRGSTLTLSVEPGSLIRVHTLDGRMVYNTIEMSAVAVVETSTFPVGAIAVEVTSGSRRAVRILPVVE